MRPRGMLELVPRLFWVFDQVSLRDTVGIVCHPASELAGYCQWSLRDRIALAVGGQSRENGGGRPVFLTFSIGPWCPTLAAKNAVRMGHPAGCSRVGLHPGAARFFDQPDGGAAEQLSIVRMSADASTLRVRRKPCSRSQA